MRRTKRFAGTMAILLAGFLDAGLPMASGQTAAAGSSSLPVAVSRSGGSSAVDAAQAAPAAAVADARTEKQKALARQAERLFDMATELKVQVDKTNKNILSMKVVEKAEEIEVLAKGMKTELRR